MHTIHPSRKTVKNILQKMNVGLFKTDVASNIYLPNNIINVLDTDDDGSIYFYSTCRKTNLAFVDKSFYCTIEFNQKGYASVLKISGVAEIVENDKISSPDNDQVLIKLVVQQSVYKSEKISLFSTLVDKFSSLKHVQ